MARPELEPFIESWGTMGSLWGINRSTARVHALLLASDAPVALDDVARELDISRGNVSMCLKELCAWGVAVRSNLPGDRRDYFAVEPDVWSMLFHIARERKKREFDPALTSLRALLRADAPAPLGPAARARLGELERVLATVNGLLEALLADERKGRALFSFLTDLVLRGAR